jgi:hypothetical protein
MNPHLNFSNFLKEKLTQIFKFNVESKEPSLFGRIIFVKKIKITQTIDLVAIFLCDFLKDLVDCIYVLLWKKNNFDGNRNFLR